jgi:hypothetical protein
MSWIQFVMKVKDEYNISFREALKKASDLKKKGKMGASKKQGYNARLDESLAKRSGKASTKKASYKTRRAQSKGMERALGRRAYASVKSMDKKRRTAKVGKKTRGMKTRGKKTRGMKTRGRK